MSEQGYMITIVGEKFVKETLFVEEKPSDNELREIVKENKGIKAFITPTEIFTIN